MRIGCCLNLLGIKPGTAGEEHIKTLADAGFDYLEVPLAEATALSDDDFTRLVQRIKNLGLVCESCNNFLPKSLRLTGPEADLDAAIIYVERAFKRAEALGAEVVVFGSPPAKNLPEGFPYQNGFVQLSEFLQRIDNIAAKHDITITIEPISRPESNIINTFEEGCRLAKAADCSNVKVLVDYFHMANEHENPDILLALGADYLRHAHFASPDGRTFPKELKDDAGYIPFFNALKRAGYDSRISVEAFSKDIAADSKAALKFFKEAIK